MELLQVRDLTINASFKSGDVSSIVSNLSFSLDRGEKVALVGRSGEGKTMVAMSILGLLPYNCYATGDILLNDRNLLKLPKKDIRSVLRHDIAYISQSGLDFLNPSMSVKALLKEAAGRGVGNDKLIEILASQGFEDPKHVLKLYPFQLSGGMAQRIVIILAKLSNPNLVIADEPTKGIIQIFLMIPMLPMAIVLGFFWEEDRRE